jgi:hypothetical protein
LFSTIEPNQLKQQQQMMMMMMMILQQGNHEKISK